MDRMASPHPPANLPTDRAAMDNSQHPHTDNKVTVNPLLPQHSHPMAPQVPQPPATAKAHPALDMDSRELAATDSSSREEVMVVVSRAATVVVAAQAAMVAAVIVAVAAAAATKVVAAAVAAMEADLVDMTAAAEVEVVDIEEAEEVTTKILVVTGSAAVTQRWNYNKTQSSYKVFLKT